MGSGSRMDGNTCKVVFKITTLLSLASGAPVSDTEAGMYETKNKDKTNNKTSDVFFSL
ncbi:hypothetical protein LWM68_02270 [Niabella sp. W65]|nr:hypothetical protein [Niabella sp. W65]MCH7361708.1 hypothetical protein [Niabella sp. W65]